MNKPPLLIRGIVGTLILVVGLLAAFSYGYLTACNGDLRQCQVSAPVASTTSTASNTPAPSAPSSPQAPIVEAILLLPPTSTVTNAVPISDHLFWISAEANNHPDNLPNQDYQSWVVNTRTKTATLAASRQIGIPYVRIMPDINHTAYGYLLVETEASWEGVGQTYFDYYDVETGSLHTSLLWQTLSSSGDALVIEYGGTTTTVNYSPKNPCPANRQDGTPVTIRGIDVNGQLIPFKNPRTITCGYSEMLDYSFLPDFEKPAFSHVRSEKKEFVYFSVPEIGRVSIDLREKDLKKAVELTTNE